MAWHRFVCIRCALRRSEIGRAEKAGLVSDSTVWSGIQHCESDGRGGRFHDWNLLCTPKMVAEITKQLEAFARVGALFR